MDKYDRLVKLGDMLGDGLGDEPDEKWIKKEYTRILHSLPEFKELKKEARKRKSEKIAVQMEALLTKKNCTCGGSLYQKRKGTKIVYCSVCNARYKAVKKINK